MTPRNPTLRKYSIKASARPLSRAVQAALFGMALAVPLGMAVVAQPVWAQTDLEVQFDIPAGSLATALTRFASTAAVTVSFDPAHATGQASAGLRGRYTVDAGLRQLLAGSKLQAVRQANGSYSLLADHRRWCHPAIGRD